MDRDYQAMLDKKRTGQGFIAALDQSGGSTPKALKLYGVGEDAYSNEAEMFDRIHEMRTRIITSPSFNGDRVLGAILFEMTMDREIEGRGTADYLWNVKKVVPFLKIDKGLEDEADGVQLMKPMPGLDELLARADRGSHRPAERRRVRRTPRRRHQEHLRGVADLAAELHPPSSSAIAFSIARLTCALRRVASTAVATTSVRLSVRPLLRKN